MDFFAVEVGEVTGSDVKVDSGKKKGNILSHYFQYFHDYEENF